jgi:hypothetical protein
VRREFDASHRGHLRIRWVGAEINGIHGGEKGEDKMNDG